MRPIFFGAELDPPRMDVLFPSFDGKHRIVTGVRILTPVSTLDEAKAAALREVRAFTPDQVELLHEISAVFDRSSLAPDRPDPALAVQTAVLQMERRPSGPVFCPACCRKLGQGDSPALGYLSRCPGCARRLAISSRDGAIVIEITFDDSDQTES